MKRCMYMCAAVLLVLSSIFFCCVPSSFASESLPFLQLVYQTSTDGTNWSATAFTSIQDTTLSWGGTVGSYGNTSNLIAKHVKILGFRCFLGNTKNTEFWFQFNLGGFYGYSDITPEVNHIIPTFGLNISGANNGAKAGTSYNSVGASSPGNNATWYCYCNISPQPISPPNIILQSPKYHYYYNQVYFFPSAYDYSGWLGNGGQNSFLRSIYVRFRPNVNSDSNTQSYFEFTTPIILTLSYSYGSGYASQYGTCITDFSFFQSYNFLLDTAFNNFQTQWDNQHNALMSRLQTYFADTQNIYTWDEIQNTEDGSEIITLTGNWWSAMLGQLRSLNADAQTQWYAQERAREAGAMDALDGAMDSADIFGSFGSVTDLFGVGSMGHWDPGSASDNGIFAFQQWFSSTTRSDLDQVPAAKKGSDDYISFYSKHIDDILDKLGVDDQDDRHGTTYFRGD